MSESEQLLQKQATEAIHAGEYFRALDLADRALAIAPQNADLHVVRGIALASTGKPDEASAEFREAIRVDPANGRAYYNLATHLYQTGQSAEALVMARESARLDPSFEGASNLVRLLESEASAPRQSRIETNIPSPYGMEGPGPRVRSTSMGQMDPQYRRAWAGIPFVRQAGQAWTAMGWSLSFLSMGLFFTTIVIYANALMSDKVDLTDFAAMNQRIEAVLGNTSHLLANLQTGLVVLTFLWMILDLIDRRGNFVWLVGLFVMSCGFHWVLMPIYLLFGRKSQFGR